MKYLLFVLFLLSLLHLQMISLVLSENWYGLENEFEFRKNDNFDQQIILKSLSDPPCPIQPIPVQIPLNPLPSPISIAFQTIEETFTSMMKNKSINPAATGMVASMTYMGQTIWNFTYGSTDITNSTSPNGDTIYRIGSISKLFAAIMAYQLYDQNIIRSLDDLISDYQPNFTINNPFPGSTGITFRQVLSQLSGLPREAPCGPCVNLTNEVMYERISQLYLIIAPYSRPSYSNLGFSLLAHVMEELVGMKFEDYVQLNILDPLQMYNTGFNITEDIISQMAVGYLAGGIVAPLTDLGWNSAAGQMYSTVNDLTKLSNWFMSSQGATVATSVLGSNLIKEMMNPIYIQGNDINEFATPFETYFVDTYNVRTKGGDIQGYASLFSVIPELQFGFNMLFNTMLTQDSFMNVAFNELIPAFIQTLSKIQPNPPQPTNSSNYFGEYVFVQGGGVAVVSVIEYKSLLLVEIYAPYPNLFESYFLQATSNPSNFQVWFPQGLVSCDYLDLVALEGEYLIFGLGSNGIAQNVTIPYISYSVVFTKHNENE